MTKNCPCCACNFQLPLFTGPCQHFLFRVFVFVGLKRQKTNHCKLLNDIVFTLVVEHAQFKPDCQFQRLCYLFRTCNCFAASVYCSLSAYSVSCVRLQCAYCNRKPFQERECNGIYIQPLHSVVYFNKIESFVVSSCLFSLSCMYLLAASIYWVWAANYFST